MTYINSIKIDGTTKEAQTLYDAFGRQRISQPYTIWDSKTINGNEELFWDDQEVSGSGTTSSFLTNKSSYNLKVSSNTAGHRVRQSKMRGNYQPSKSQLMLLTILVGEGNLGITKRWGVFDDKNGLFFQLKDGVFSVGVRTNTSGTSVDNIIEQQNFNFDKLDGTGYSDYNINFNTSIIFFIDFEWLGVGKIRYGIVDKGKYIICNTIDNSQTLLLDEIVYLSNPSLPIRYEIINDGTGIESDLYTICSAIQSEGGQDDTSLQTYISRGSNILTLGATNLFTPVISLRLKSLSNNGTAPDVEALTTKIKINNIDTLITTNINFEWRLYLNPIFDGVDNANWVNIINSSIQYDISRDATNTITDGFIISGGYGSSTNQIKSNISQDIKSYLSMGGNIDRTTDEMVLAIADMDAGGGSAYGAISFTEYT